MHLVVGFAIGGAGTTAAWRLAEAVESLTGRRVLVENRPGADGFLAADWVKKQQKAKSLYVMSSTSAARVPSDFGLVPVGIFATYDFVSVVRADAPPDIESYMAAAKTDRQLRLVGTAGAGSVARLVGLRLFEAHGISMDHVAYQGSSPAVTAVLGGEVPMAIVPRPDFRLKDELRVLASSGFGMPTSGWMGIYAPPETSAEEIGRLVTLLQLAAERAKAKLEESGFTKVWKSAEELAAVHSREFKEWAPVLDSLGIKF